MKRFLALAQGLGFVPCRAPLLFLIRKNFLSYLFSATAGRKVSVHYHQQNIICTLFFFFGINLFLKRITLSRCHSRILRLNFFLFWSRLQVSQLENNQCWRWWEISWNLFRGVTYLWSVSAVSRSTINILMFLFPAVSCFWLWLHLWCSSDFVLTGPCTASGNTQIRSLPVSVVFLLTVLKLAK